MVSLTNYLKYCLSYIRLTNRRFFRAQKDDSIPLEKIFFELRDFLRAEDHDAYLDQTLLNLKVFYNADPLTVSKDLQKEYDKQKKLANKIEDLYNRYKNDPYTKQLNLNFGHFEIQIPNDEEVELAEDGTESEKKTPALEIERYPLFSLPVTIEKVSGRYYIKPTDTEIQVNLSLLEPLFGEDLFYQVIEEIGVYEVQGSLTLPVANPNLFTEIWEKLQKQLKLTQAIFGEDSFKLDDFELNLIPRMNYFLVEDLLALTKIPENTLTQTSLNSWTTNDNLTFEKPVPSEGELYFPFDYNKFQSNVLTITDNVASIVQGPPGTGKSQTIANLLCHLAATGKKVLFVSQKAQALKVVKDKLKETKIKYLFGYIPNMRSQQISQEDERDSIAHQLANLEYFLNNRRQQETVRQLEPLQVIADEKVRHQNLYNTSIEEQRLYYQYEQEIAKHAAYDLEITDIQAFIDIFSLDSKDLIDKQIKFITQLQDKIKRYQIEQNQKKAEFEQTFKIINTQIREKNYSAYIKRIRDRISQKGYDGHSKMLRSFHVFMHTVNQKKLHEQLPREINDLIFDILRRDYSKSELLLHISGLYDYVDFLESTLKLEIEEKRLSNMYHDVGLTETSYKQTEQLLQKEQFNLVKQKIELVYSYKLKRKQLLLADTNQVSELLQVTEASRKQRVIEYLQKIISQKIETQYGLIKIRQVVRKLEKVLKKSKKAFKTFDNLKKDPEIMEAIIDLVPIWIMELDDASRIMPLKNGLFDYVIFDEASQCNIAYAIPSMYRTKHTIFVGDPRQMRDDTIRFKTNKSFNELAKRYDIPYELNIKPSQESVQSVLDVAYLRGFKDEKLLYHYRSPRELIGFSNLNFYSNKLISLNSNYFADEDKHIMSLHQVKVNKAKETIDRVNISEAQAIIKFVTEIKKDKRYRNKSIGILTFFNQQATYLRELLEKAGFEDKDDVKVSIIDGIQGDEKDIIIYSFVITSPEQKNRYISLTSEGGEVNKDLAAGRVNVAFSRARLQVHCFVSMSVSDFPEGIWIKRFLQYVEKHGIITFFDTDLKPFESKFEEEFYTVMSQHIGQNFVMQNQVQSCGFKIDFVISNPKNGKKIAVECDGPTNFKNESDEEYGLYVKTDEERERVLKSAGWQFNRVNYSDWEKNKTSEEYISSILKLISI